MAGLGGVSGSAYLVAGLGMTVLKRGNVLVVPIRTGVGARLWRECRLPQDDAVTDLEPVLGIRQKQTLPSCFETSERRIIRSIKVSGGWKRPLFCSAQYAT